MYCFYIKKNNIPIVVRYIIYITPVIYYIGEIWIMWPLLDIVV